MFAVLLNRIGAAIGLTLLILLAMFSLPSNARGGLYNPCEPDEGPFGMDWMGPRGRGGFRDLLFKYRSITMDKIEVDNPTRQRYLLVQQSAPENTDRLTPLQRLSLSEYLIRRGDAVRAQFLLRSLSRSREASFLVCCNLATAFAQTREYDKAIDALQDALSKWPTSWDKLPAEQKDILKNMQWAEHTTFNRCREAEEFFLKMLKSRQKEVRKRWRSEQSLKTAAWPAVYATSLAFPDLCGGFALAHAAQAVKLPLPDTELDDLFFPGKDASQTVHYVDENGDFTPGKLAASENAKFPDGKIDRAIAIVQQLLIWMPWDASLYRQLGELYSARGQPDDILAARMIFNELVESMNSSNADVKMRRRRLSEVDVPASQRENDSDTAKDILKDTKDAKESAPISGRSVAVIFGFGIIVGVIGQWQINEIRRRRQRAAQRSAALK